MTIETHRHRLGHPSHLSGEQPRNRHHTDRRLGQHGPVTDIVETSMLDDIEHIDRRQPPSRIIDQRLGDARQPVDHGLDAGRVEHVGPELHRAADPCGVAGVVPPFSQCEREVHPGHVGIHRQRTDLCLTQSRFGRGVGGEVLPGQRHLDQRVMSQRSGRLEPIHEYFERHILVLECGQAALAHLGQQLGNCRVAG